MLKRFIPKVQRELMLLSLGQSSVIEWATNDADSIKVKMGMMKGIRRNYNSPSSNANQACMAPMLKGLALPDGTGEPIFRRLEELVNELRKFDITIDADNFIKVLHFAVKKRAETKSK